MVLVASLLLAVVGSVVAYASPPRDCKCLPGDGCWPRPDEWARLNRTVGGRLLATVPLGSPCYESNYDAATCAKLRGEWLNPPVHYQSSSSVMAPLFANQSCDPFQPKDSPCTLGNYVRYAVDAAGPEDIRASLGFARRHKIRLVIRNTGHDYNGRSTGAGALADDSYTGKALQVGAGVQGFEALAAARKAGLVLVTGSCPTVGIAGGYVQGGGHSALSSVYGLAADNTLSFDVVTPSGHLVTASPSRNRDLYWALSGGGGGNYGIVVSITFRAHPDATVSGASFGVTVPEGDADKIFRVVDAFHATLPNIVDAGGTVIYAYGSRFLQIATMTIYNKTKAEAQHILQPFADSVASMGISFKPNFTQYANYYDHFNHYFGPQSGALFQVGNALIGGRLIPRSILPHFSPTAKRLVEMGVTVAGVGLNVSRFGRDHVNSVLPQWRDSIVAAPLTLPWSFAKPFEEMVAEQDRITHQIQPVIEAATPDAGAYMNEADFQQPDFQQTFYGANYPRLLRIKRKYDPHGLLYVRTGVGSEDWIVHRDGRMCRTNR